MFLTSCAAQVDMMISMVDGDGDGQVSFEEFHRLVIDPDPSRVDFGTEPIKTDAQEAVQVSQASVAARRMEAIFGRGHTYFGVFVDACPVLLCWTS